MDEDVSGVKNGKPLGSRLGHSVLMIRLIAVSKLLKSMCLLLVGGVLLHTMRLDNNVAATLHDIVNAQPIDENNHLIHGLLEKALGISAVKLRVIYTGTLVYSGLYLTEGIGLFLDKAWAEWMTIITTTGFIPLEIYEIFNEPTILRVGIFGLNVAILVYLILRLHWRYVAIRELGNAMGGFPVKLKDTQGLHGK